MSTYGIIFAGTPHQGGEGVAWGVRLVNIASIFANTNKTTLQHLERDSEEVQRLLRDYAPISNEFVTKFAYDTLLTRLPIGNYVEVSLPLLQVSAVLRVHPGCTQGFGSRTWGSKRRGDRN